MDGVVCNELDGRYSIKTEEGGNSIIEHRLYWLIVSYFQHVCFTIHFLQLGNLAYIYLSNR